MPPIDRRFAQIVVEMNQVGRKAGREAP